MIDTHLHILPGIDDGSRDFEESIAMAKKLVALGFTGGFTTSHFIPNSDQLADNKTKTRLRKELQARLDELGIEFKLYPGNEIYVDPEMVKYMQEDQASLLGETTKLSADAAKNKKKKHYVLFEVPFMTEVGYLREVIFEMKSQNIVPILAHPERYEFLQKKPEKALELRKIGVKLQCNIGSMAKQYGSKPAKTMKYFLKHGLVDFLGTDAHRADGSVFEKYEKACKKIRKIITDEGLRKLQENSLSINH